MYAKKQVIYTVLALIFFFAVGWKTSEYYAFTNNVPQSYFPSVTEDIPKETNTNSQADMSLFWDVWDELDMYYVDETAVQDKTNLVYGAIKGLADSVDDPYTVFMDPEETKQFDENLNGSLTGIGAELTVEDGLLTVISPLKDSPAEKAGLLPGDTILQIDGEIAAEMTMYDAIMSIRGEKGTEVTLTIVREEVDEPFDITIVREEITVDSVYYELLEDNIAYVAITQFSENSPDEFSDAVKQIILDDPKGLIIDLRFNGGGYLDKSVDILSELVEGTKPAVQIQTRLSEENETLYLWGNARLPEIPLVVLVNDGSASAAEIVAGAIQDYKRGLVMGETTYGKGSVQEVIYLNEGASLRMSIAHWLTPKGRSIEDVGITPDRIVELTYEDAVEGNDTQLDEAVNYLLNL